jgi:hypothetical protein
LKPRALARGVFISGNNLLEKGEISIEIKFENRENIIVRGKTFLDSVRILRIFTSESDIESSFKKKENIWFAKDIGIIKKIEEEFSFNPQKDEADISIDILELKKAFCYENY